MDIEMVVQLINGVGFPIAVSVALFWTNTKQNERYEGLIRDLTNVINNNTKVLSELQNSCSFKNGGV